VSEVTVMKDDEVGLFDGEDVDTGDEPPDDDDISAAEVAAIRASQADPATPPPDAEGN
jgi:hypothetical protein